MSKLARRFPNLTAIIAAALGGLLVTVVPAALAQREFGPSIAASRIRETGGPTNLAIGAIPANTVLYRNGSSQIVGNAALGFTLSGGIGSGARLVLGTAASAASNTMLHLNEDGAQMMIGDSGIRMREGGGTLDFNNAAGSSGIMSITQSGHVSLLNSNQLRLADGTAGAPGVAFAADTDTGVFRQGDNDMVLAAGAVAVIRVLDTEIQVKNGSSKYANMPISSVGDSRPTYSTNSDTNTGMYLPADDTIRLTTAGTMRVALDASNGLAAAVRIQGTSAAVTAANNLTLGAGNLQVVSGNTTVNCIDTANWQAGAVVTLLFSGTPTVTDSSGGCATTFKLVNIGAAFTATADDVMTLVYDGTDWKEVSRSVN